MSMLYVVGTPIGNLSDFSNRAIETLEKVDFIAAEDTRVTLKLLNRFNIKKPMVSYYEHNLRERGEEIINRIRNGETCAVVSDAGMPCISDPGEDLVRLCAENNIPVSVVPGPTAMASALAVSGLITSRFTFEGFLSTNKGSRQKHLDSLKNEERTMIFYEAPHKLLSTLNDLYNAFGDRKITLARELTKIHEEILRMTLKQAVEYYTDKTIKGEFVLVLEGKTKIETEEKLSFDDVVKIAKKLVESGVKATDAAREVAGEYGYKKSDIYKEML